MSITIEASEFARLKIFFITVRKEMKLRSTTTMSNVCARESPERFLIFVRSKTVTRLSDMIFSWRSPYPTSTQVTRCAPRCNKQSVKPPVEDPMSIQFASSTGMPKDCIACASFSPPRLTNCLGGVAKTILSDCLTSWLTLRAKLPLTFTWRSDTSLTAS